MEEKRNRNQRIFWHSVHIFTRINKQTNSNQKLRACDKLSKNYCSLITMRVIAWDVIDVCFLQWIFTFCLRQTKLGVDRRNGLNCNAASILPFASLGFVTFTLLIYQNRTEFKLIKFYCNECCTCECASMNSNLKEFILVVAAIRLVFCFGSQSQKNEGKRTHISSKPAHRMPDDTRCKSFQRSFHNANKNEWKKEERTKRGKPTQM